MSNNLKSNWLGGSNHAPTKFRTASNGKVFTRTEKIHMILQERKSKELIANARGEAAEQSANRKRFYEGVNTLSENPQSKLRHSKEGVYIQPRVDGSFGSKINF